MIKLSNLNKIYHTATRDLQALKNINLTVEPGEIVGVIGKSGAGKSTLIRCVNLLERPTSGSVQVNGVELTTLSKNKLREERHRIGMVFQHFNLLSSRTVFDNVAFPLELMNYSKKDIQHTVLSLLDQVNLLDKKHAFPEQLSGGQKQRVAIARALSTKPSVLLCDEMTSALDPETTDEILQLIRDIHQEYRLSILCITHEMGVIKSIADRVAVIDHAEIVECESVPAIFKQPKTDIAKRLIQSVFKTDLPHELQSVLRDVGMPLDHVIVRVTFMGHATVEPLLQQFMQQTPVAINILQANIEQLRKELIGRMIIAMPYEKESLFIAMQYLQEKGLTVEVMGYVDAHAWSID